MVDKKKIYLLIQLNKILFLVLSEDNKILFQKESKLTDFTIEKNFLSLEKFLEKNLISIEKKFKNFINDIILIINLNIFINVNISSTINVNYLYKDQLSYSRNLLNLKNYMTKHMNNYYLTNMFVNKFIVDGKENLTIPENIKNKKVFIELKFCFIAKIIANKYKKIFSEYGISIKKIYDLKFLNSFEKSTNENILNTICNLDNAQNNTEINFLHLKTNKTGFFTKFFDLFR